MLFVAQRLDNVIPGILYVIAHGFASAVDVFSANSVDDLPVFFGRAPQSVERQSVEPKTHVKMFERRRELPGEDPVPAHRRQLIVKRTVQHEPFAVIDVWLVRRMCREPLFQWFEISRV
jgi:hypothetical protein